jgi:hypothetical protein
MTHTASLRGLRKIALASLALTTLALAAGTAGAQSLPMTQTGPVVKAVRLSGDLGRARSPQIGGGWGDAVYAVGMELESGLAPLALQVSYRSMSFNVFGSDVGPDTNTSLSLMGLWDVRPGFRLTGRLGTGSTRLERGDGSKFNRAEAVYGIGVRAGHSQSFDYSFEALRFPKSEMTQLMVGMGFNF